MNFKNVKCLWYSLQIELISTGQQSETRTWRGVGRLWQMINLSSSLVSLVFAVTHLLGPEWQNKMWVLRTSGGIQCGKELPPKDSWWKNWERRGESVYVPEECYSAGNILSVYLQLTQDAYLIPLKSNWFKKKKKLHNFRPGVQRWIIIMGLQKMIIKNAQTKSATLHSLHTFHFRLNFTFSRCLGNFFLSNFSQTIADA